MNRLTLRLSNCNLSKPSIVAGPRGGNLAHIFAGQPRNEQPCRFLSSVAHPPNFQVLSVSARKFSTEATAAHKVVSDTEGGVETSRIFADSGVQYGMLLDTRKLPKLKPSIVQRRLAKCKTYEGKEKSIRQSPWKLNRICELAAGLTLEDALTQLKFCDLKNADLVAKVLKRTSNLADIRDGLQVSQLEVAECFATKAMMLRRIKPMGRGRCVKRNFVRLN